MIPVIPISKFQRQTKNAFEEAVDNGYKYVVSHNNEIAVVMKVSLFKDFERYLKNKDYISNKKMHIDDFRGYFGKCAETSVELQHKALQLWTKD